LTKNIETLFCDDMADRIRCWIVVWICWWCNTPYFKKTRYQKKENSKRM